MAAAVQILILWVLLLSGCGSGGGGAQVVQNINGDVSTDNEPTGPSPTSEGPTSVNPAPASPASEAATLDDTAPGPSRPAPVEVLRTYPHDSSAFTQGLLFENGFLWESTGGYGTSSIRRVNIESGQVIQQEALFGAFGEGIARLGNRLYQATLEGQTGYIYDLPVLQRSGTFTYEGEGWGLTSDGNLLILSDGTSSLRFINTEINRVEHTVQVTEGGVPVAQLNELEWVRGEIWANVWHSDRIVRIDPQTGIVRGSIDLSALAPAVRHQNPEAVLNGIAWDSTSDRIFVTGKLWPVLYEIRVP
ncbi:glutaminyl-peptide cyclotransferase [Geobacter sp. DSM 9736]|nr:glutaminyl-peptide cyclotransferase [Geobacter sp. DSM 9736]